MSVVRYSRRKVTFNGAMTAAFTAIVLVATSSVAASQATASPSGPDHLTDSALALANQAGFAHIDTARLTMTKSIAALPVTPTLAVVLPRTVAPALTDGNTVINGKAADGSVVVAQPGGFGVVTDRHAQVEFRYKTVSNAGTTLVASRDGGLDEKNSAGVLLAHIDPASAIDS